MNYHVVFRFCRVQEQFVIAGIFSKRADADDLIVSLKANAAVDSFYGDVVVLTHDQLVHQLTDARLGEMAAALNKLLPA